MTAQIEIELIKWPPVFANILMNILIILLSSH